MTSVSTCGVTSPPTVDPPRRRVRPRATPRSWTVLAAALLLVVTGIVGVAVNARGARAAGAAYDRNMIITNQVFDATGTMSTAQIQAHLDRYPNSCLRNHRAVVPQAYSSYGSEGSAAEVIRAAATLWGVNPQVLLVTLEKEQSLVTGGAGCAPWRYWSAMGYGCPDGGAQYEYPSLGITSTCVSNINWAGFSAQVNRGAWQLQFNKQRAEGNLYWNDNQSVTNYGFYTTGLRRAREGAPEVYYDGWATIDGTPVFMTNGATATLYTYTPHLSANKAFYDLFTNWFGSVGTPPSTTVAPQPPTTAPPPTVPTPSAQDIRYVDGVHRRFMGRAATAGEKHLWGTYLRDRGSRSGFVNHVVGSDEYARHLVDDAYRWILRRPADAGGLQAWTGVVERTARDDAMVSGLAGSVEYFEKRGKRDHLIFLEALYQDLLGRGIDTSGVATWGARLADGSMSRTQVAFTVLQSEEYARRAVGKSYALVLGRWPDEPGWDYWSASYLRTHRVAELNASLGASTEGYHHLSR